MNDRDDRPETTGTGAPAVEQGPAKDSIPSPAKDSPEDNAQESPEPCIEDFNDQISNCEEDLQVIDQQVDELRRQRAQIESERDELLSNRNRLFPPPNQAQAVRSYLEQQQRNREDRAARFGQLIEMGLVSPKAPIDAVRQRSKGYGNRPVQHPTLNAKA